MKKIKNENMFLIGWSICILILVSLCFLNVRETRAYFNGGTTGTFNAYNVYYLSNYPDSSMDVEPVVNNQSSNIYRTLENMFSVPEGYEFVGWMDENGNEYTVLKTIYLTADLYLYAKWNLVVSSEPEDGVDVSKIAYGDVNLNGEIDTDDYVLIENYINGVSSLEEYALLNADVNVDGKIDLVDVDIVKQVCLGNNSYLGYLPNNPILIYDIYEGNIDIGSGEITDGNGESNDGDNTSSSGGTGSGNSGTGSGSSGNGTGSNTSSNGSGTGSASSSGNSSSSGNISSGGSDKNEEENDIKKVFYEFKFVSGNEEYANTKCEVINNNNCELVLPDAPKKDGFIFKGWSIDTECDNIINAPIIVDGSNIYYACFVVDNSDNGSKKNSYVGIIVFAICLLTARLIWYLIYKFKKNEDNIDLD